MQLILFEHPTLHQAITRCTHQTLNCTSRNARKIWRGIRWSWRRNATRCSQQTRINNKNARQIIIWAPKWQLWIDRCPFWTYLRSKLIGLPSLPGQSCPAPLTYRDSMALQSPRAVDSRTVKKGSLRCTLCMSKSRIRTLTARFKWAKRREI